MKMKLAALVGLVAAVNAPASVTLTLSQDSYEFDGREFFPRVEWFESSSSSWREMERNVYGADQYFELDEVVHPDEDYLFAVTGPRGREVFAHEFAGVAIDVSYASFNVGFDESASFRHASSFRVWNGAFERTDQWGPSADPLALVPTPATGASLTCGLLLLVRRSPQGR